MKSKILGLTQLALVLLLIVVFQNCSSPTSDAVTVDGAESIESADFAGAADNPPVHNGNQATKVPTKNCTMNSVKYKCVTISYGKHALQNYELWLPSIAHASGDRPLVVYFHGGGYYKGDKKDAYLKSSASEEAKGYDGGSAMPELLNLGYAVATVNYRLVDENPFVDGAMEFPPQFQDAAWAVQDLRMRASDYGYNPKKVALTGVSAGGGLSLWLAFHEDLKNTTSQEERERFSSKVQCVAVRDTQTTINVSEIQALLGPQYEIGYGISTMFGFEPEDYSAEPALYEQTFGSDMSNASALGHLDADDVKAKVMLSYMLGYGTTNIHAAEFGRYLAEGSPVDVKNRYKRKSLLELGIAYTLKVKQTPTAQKNSMISHINSCFANQ